MYAPVISGLGTCTLLFSSTSVTNVKYCQRLRVRETNIFLLPPTPIITIYTTPVSPPEILNQRTTKIPNKWISYTSSWLPPSPNPLSFLWRQCSQTLGSFPHHYIYLYIYRLLCFIIFVCVLVYIVFVVYKLVIE